MDTSQNGQDNGQDATSDTSSGQPQDGQDMQPAWLPLKEAAPLLGLSVEAARKRAQRGTIRARKADDGWLVAWPSEMDTSPDSGQDIPRVVLDDNTRGGQDVHRDTGRTRHGHGQAGEHDVPQSVQALIDAQRSEIAFLRGELETRSEEIRRRDHILAGLLQELSTIKALAPGEIIDAEERTRETPESAHAPVDAMEGSGRAQPPQMTNETSQEGHAAPLPRQATQVTGWQRWLRRIMGHEG